MSDVAITQLGIIGVLLLGYAYNLYRERRDRGWARQDAAEIKQALAENTKISKDAFTEANTVNLKIATVVETTRRMGEVVEKAHVEGAAVTAKQLDTIQQTSTDTNQRVRSSEARDTKS